MIRVTTAAVLALAGTALAQYEITIDVETPVLMPVESTTVTMFVGYGGTDYAVAGLMTNLVTSVGSEGWSDAALVAPMDGPGTVVGALSSTGYDGIIAGQLNFPRHFYADPTNPIAFWEATYTAPIDITAPFDVDVSTATSRYDAYPHRQSYTSESRLADLVEGTATIRVIPAPASASLLALGMFATRRRR